MKLGHLYINNKHQQNIITDGEPVKCGYKVDGKDVFVIRKNIGALPDVDSSEIYDIGFTIDDIDMIDVYVVGYATWGQKMLSERHTTISLRDTGILIETDFDHTSLDGVVTMYFTYK